MIKIGEGFAFPSNIDLSVLDKLPVHVHRYGSPQPDSSVFQWMEYYNEGYEGSIAFCRNIGTHWPEAASTVIEFLDTVLPNWPLDPNRVTFMRTAGEIPPHRDEGGRLCAINIGVRDASSATTRVSLDDDFDTFDTDYADYVAQDGCAYLLNVSRVHSVYTTRPGKRLMVSYGFGVPFSRVRAGLRL
jgi:hypothetical protein